MTAKITVVTAVLNQVEALRETVQSVFNQNYPNLDYFIVDGGSTDGTVDVLREYEGRLAGWVSESDEGVYSAMNKGWDIADPESYIVFLGAGDRLVSLPKELPGPDPRPAVCFGRVMLDDDQEFVSHANWRLRLYNSLHHQGLLVPKSLHPQAPFNGDFHLYADFDFNQRLKKQGVHFYFIPEFVTYASSGGLTMETNVREMTSVVKQNYGGGWGELSKFCFNIADRFPLLKKFRPIRQG